MSWMNYKGEDNSIPEDGRPSDLVLQDLLYNILQELTEIKLYLKTMSDEDFVDDAADDVSDRIQL